MQRLAETGDDKSLEEELQSCRHFLVDSEIQKGRHCVFNCIVNNLTAQVIEELFYPVLDKLECAEKLNIAFGFIEKKSKTGNSDTFMLMRTTPYWNSQIL